MNPLQNTYLDFLEKKSLHVLPKACAAIIQCAPKFSFDQSSSANLVAQLLPNLKIYEVTTTSHPHHPHSHVTDNNNGDLSLLIPVDGSAVIRTAHDDPVYCLSGDALLISNDSVLRIHTADLIFLAVINVPKVLISSATSNSSNTPLMEKLAITATPGLHLLKGYVKTLMKLGRNRLPDGVVLLASSQIQDMITLLLSAKREVLGIPMGRNTRVVRLKAIKSDIEKHIDDSDLTINQVAMRQGVSSQYIRSLFRIEKTTFSEYVTQLRLERICRLLRNPLYANYSISALAFEMGFNNLSWFNRTFKTHFGMTPTELRNLFIPDHNRF